MNKKLDEFKGYIKSKKVAVLGIGISNIPLIKYLSGIGVEITAFDRSEESSLKAALDELKGCNARFNLGEHYLDKLEGFDIIFKTPKIRFDIPELLREKKKGALITSEMEVFVDLCPAEIFAVTGSDGKTTTTTLIYKMLKEHGYKCWLGGNIGTPLLDRIDEINENDKVVLELSSFQLQTMKKSPGIAVITNLSPNHLDVHKSMDEYIDAKKNIFRYQASDGKLVLNYDNEITRNMAYEAGGNTMYFSRVNTLKEGVVLEGDTIVFKDETVRKEIIKADDILLPGVHNVENYLAAISAVINHVDIRDIYNTATNFRGVEHRNEPVREINGIKFYNDSIGSSPTRTKASLRAFKQKVILIAGGYDKQIPYDDIGEVIVEKVKCLVLTGPTGSKISEALKNEVNRTGKGKDIPVFMCKSLEDAVATAYKNASSGDIIILSPASASFDMFKNFEERGNRFKQLVNAI